MTKSTIAVPTIFVLALANASAFAMSDREAIEEGCRQAAVEENIDPTEFADYVADCVDANLMSYGSGAEGSEGEAAGTQAGEAKPSEF